MDIVVNLLTVFLFWKQVSEGSMGLFFVLLIVLGLLFLILLLQRLHHALHLSLFVANVSQQSFEAKAHGVRTTDGRLIGSRTLLEALFSAKYSAELLLIGLREGVK